MDSKMEARLMDKRCISEVVSVIHDTVTAYHGEHTDAKFDADYAAVAFFALCDMGLHKLDEKKRHEQFSLLAERLKVMSEVCAQSGIRGLTIDASN